MFEKEYTHKKKIKICKYNLKEKCKFGEKCNFLHVSISEMERALEHLNFLMKENESLKTLLKKKVQETRTFGSLESRANEFESNGVNAIKKVDEKVSYSSHFKQKEATSEYLHLRFNGIKSNVENPFQSHSEKRLVQENSQISK